MDVSLIDKRLLSHPGATKALHESWGWMVYWVGGKQFACEFIAAPDAKPPYAGRHLLSLKCDTDRIRELRAEFPDAARLLLGWAHVDLGRSWVHRRARRSFGGARPRPVRHELSTRVLQADEADAAPDRGDELGPRPLSFPSEERRVA